MAIRPGATAIFSSFTGWAPVKGGLGLTLRVLAIALAIAMAPLQCDGGSAPPILIPLTSRLVPIGHQLQSRWTSWISALTILGKDGQTREIGPPRLAGHGEELFAIALRIPVPVRPGASAPLARAFAGRAPPCA